MQELERTALDELYKALEQLLEATSGDIYTDAPEMQFSVIRVYTARQHAKRVIEAAKGII